MSSLKSMPYAQAYAWLAGITAIRTQRIINEWNKLSTDCVTASSVNMFKNKVDTYLRRAGYVDENC